MDHGAPIGQSQSFPEIMSHHEEGGIGIFMKTFERMEMSTEN